MGKTIEVKVGKFSEINAEVGDRLIDFIDVGPFIVIKPNEEEEKVIERIKESDTKYLFSVADGSYLNSSGEISILAICLEGEAEDVRIIERYKRGNKRYEELHKILRDKFFLPKHLYIHSL